MPMKGHSKSGCRIVNSSEQKGDGVSIISSAPSFVIPETGPFRRQNPNYVLPTPPQVEPLVLSSASFTPTEPVCSVNTMQRSFPPLQQLTPNWSRPSSPQPTRRVLKQQPSFALGATSEATALLPSSVFDAQPGDAVKLVAGIYQVPIMTVESLRTRALSNGIYCVPLEPFTPKEERLQNLDSTWIVTGPNISDVDVLVSILQPREPVLQIRPTAIMQMIKNMNALHCGALLLLLLCVFKFVFKW